LAWVDLDNPVQSVLFRPEISSVMYFGPALALVWFGATAMQGIKAKLEKDPQ